MHFYLSSFFKFFHLYFDLWELWSCFFPYKREVKLDTLWHSAPKETNRWRLLRITWIDGFIPYYLILTLRRVIVPYHSPTFLTPPLWLLVKGKESNPRNSNSNHNSRKKRKEKKKWKKKNMPSVEWTLHGLPQVKCHIVDREWHIHHNSSSTFSSKLTNCQLCYITIGCSVCVCPLSHEQKYSDSIR